MSGQANAKPVLLIVLVLVLAGMGAGVFFTIAGGPGKQEGRVELREAEPQRAVAAGAPASRSSAAREPTPAPAAKPEGADASSRRQPSGRMARDLKREQIRSALGRKHELEPAAPGSGEPEEVWYAKLPELETNYVRAAIAEQLVPVAVDCYNSALQDDPELGGKLIMDFTIIADEEVGGVVEEASINDESTLVDPFVRECLRESLMTVVFDPPEDGGRVEVSYPLTFEPE